MNAVGYSSPFVPAEWIAAHGLRPERLRLRPTERLTRGICPYAGALLAAALGGKGDRRLLCEAREGPSRQKASVTFSFSDCNRGALVLATTCDQMRYVATMLEQRGEWPVFLLNVPSTWQTPAARGLYRDELRRLGRFLVRHDGETPSDARLTHVMLAFDRAREEDRANSRGPAGHGSDGVPLAILGGPLLETECDLFALVERIGGRIVLDATEHGERALPRPFEHGRLAADPLQELADAYFDAIPDAFQRPDSRLYEWLGRELTARQVRGVILHRYLWCDLWHAETQRLKQWSPVPVLELDVGPDDTAAPNRMQGRIEAFLEMLE
jgi:benzoyl-CoA reductase/2-hydroxyglutaryl-CoA dehydratase subunit BcrC/BadD/HgdB